MASKISSGELTLIATMFFGAIPFIRYLARRLRYRYAYQVAKNRGLPAKVVIDCLSSFNDKDLYSELDYIEKKHKELMLESKSHPSKHPLKKTMRLIKKTNYEDAEEYLKAAIKHNTIEKTSLKNALILVYRLQGKIAQEHELEKEMFASQTKNPDDNNKLGGYWQFAIHLMESGNTTEGLSNLKKALRLSTRINGIQSSESLRILLDLATAYFSSGDYILSNKVSNYIIKTSESKSINLKQDEIVGLNYTMAMSLTEQGKYIEARNLIKTILPLSKKANTLKGKKHHALITLTMAECYSRTGDYDTSGLYLEEAQVFFNKKIKFDMETECLLNGRRANLYLNLEQYDVALQIYEEVLLQIEQNKIRAPFAINILYNYATLLFQLGDYKKSKEIIKDKILPSGLSIDHAPSCYHTLGCIYERCGNYPAALDNFILAQKSLNEHESKSMMGLTIISSIASMYIALGKNCSDTVSRFRFIYHGVLLVSQTISEAKDTEQYEEHFFSVAKRSLAEGLFELGYVDDAIKLTRDNYITNKLYFGKDSTEVNATKELLINMLKVKKTHIKNN